jgi:hypothetical protein
LQIQRNKNTKPKRVDVELYQDWRNDGDKNINDFEEINKTPSRNIKNIIKITKPYFPPGVYSMICSTASSPPA